VSDVVVLYCCGCGEPVSDWPCPTCGHTYVVAERPDPERYRPGWVQFSVPGRPLPSGSKTAIPIMADGRYAGTRVVESGNRSAKAAWRADIREAASRAMDGRPVLEGPLRMTATFYLRRPAGQYGSGRNRHTVRAGAPTHPIVAPDVLKLSRGLEDALQGVVYPNDAQIVSEHIAKRYGEPERTEVVVDTFAAQLDLLRP
jgi:Holliday junction resolvase RusA-like endonuclease